MANMTTTSNQTTTQTTTHHHDRHNDDNASKARWKILREALLLSSSKNSSSSLSSHNNNNNNNNNNTISSITAKSLTDTTTTTTTTTTTELNEHDNMNRIDNNKSDDDDNDNDFHRYSIHRFQGYQFLQPSKTIILSQQQQQKHEQKNKIITSSLLPIAMTNDDQQQTHHNNEVLNGNNDNDNISSTNENSTDRYFCDNNHHLYNSLTKIIIQIPTIQECNSNNDDDIVSTTVSEVQTISCKEQLLDQLDTSLLAISALSSFLDTQRQQQQEKEEEKRKRTTLFPIHTIPFEIKFIIFDSSHCHQDDNNNSENNGINTMVKNNNNTLQSTTNTTTTSDVKYHKQFNFHELFSHIFECNDNEKKKDHHHYRNIDNNSITFTSFKSTFIMELHQRCLPELYLIDGCINNINVFVDTKEESSTSSFMIMKIQCNIRYKINPNYHHIHTIQRYDWMNNYHNRNHRNNNEYDYDRICWYTREKLTNPNKMIHKNNKKLTLRELASHQYYNNIDNTGNVCVWDCEKIMTWILLMHHQQTLNILPSLSSSTQNNHHHHQQDQQDDDEKMMHSSPTIPCESLSLLPPIITILELGVGMAGLAGLALYTAVDDAARNAVKISGQHQNGCDDDLISTQSHRYRIILTDGHPDCVRNNRINIRLCQASSSLFISDNKLNNNQVQSNSNDNDSNIYYRHDGDDDNNFKKNNHKSSLQIESRLLKWDIPEKFSSNDDNANICNAHCTIISDCIHFVEYHVELLYTAIQCTKVDGMIWLCQPNRGTSLEQFIQLINNMNHNQNENNKDYIKSISIQSPLVAMTERTYDKIEIKHQEFLTNQQHIHNTDNKSDMKDQHHHHVNNYYNPDIHKPRIIVLQKLRHINQADHQRFLANR